MIYITALTERIIQASNLNDIKQQALDALLNQTSFNTKLIDEVKYRACITHMQPVETVIARTNQQVRDNFKKQQDRIASEINAFYSLGVHPEDSYSKFYIPKRGGGLREINAPSDELALTHRNILEYLYNLQVLTHDAGFAYTKSRSTMDAIKRHQLNESQWFLKIDLKDFFPSCTSELLKNTLTSIYPFNFMQGDVLDHIIGVAMLNGGLPQGSPLSPLLSNLVMVPFDYHLTKELWNFKKQHFVYTRYADDIIISSKYSFKFDDVLAEVERLLNQFAPGHKINKEKTHYGSRSGRNWNLGLMLNKDNDITIGYRKKQRIRAMLHQLMAGYCAPRVNTTTRQTGIGRATTVRTSTPSVTQFSNDQLYHMFGMIEYARSIEPEYWDNVILKMETKTGVNFRAMRKDLLG